jgi:hypothetical protein
MVLLNLKIGLDHSKSYVSISVDYIFTLNVGCLALPNTEFHRTCTPKRIVVAPSFIKRLGTGLAYFTAIAFPVSISSNYYFL